MNYRKKYARKTKGNKDWLCKEYKSFKTQAGRKAKHKYDWYKQEISSI